MKKILIVDDDPEIVEFVVQFLSSQSYDVLSAANGKEGCARASETKPDLIILDLMMPDMHGFEVCTALRKDQNLSKVKIIVASGKKYEADKRAAQRLGADMFLSKPYSITQLLDAVYALVGKP